MDEEKCSETDQVEAQIMEALHLKQGLFQRLPTI